MRRAIVRMDYLCSYCRKEFSTTADHVIPIKQGGLDKWFNLVGACKECNIEKGPRTPKQAGMKLHVPLRWFQPEPKVLPNISQTVRGPKRFDVEVKRLPDNRKVSPIAVMMIK